MNEGEGGAGAAVGAWGSMRAAAGMKRGGYDGARRERWIRFSVKIDRGDPGEAPWMEGFLGRQDTGGDGVDCGAEGARWRWQAGEARGESAACGMGQNSTCARLL